MVCTACMVCRSYVAQRPIWILRAYPSQRHLARSGGGRPPKSISEHFLRQHSPGAVEFLRARDLGFILWCLQGNLQDNVAALLRLPHLHGLKDRLRSSPLKPICEWSYALASQLMQKVSGCSEVLIVFEDTWALLLMTRKRGDSIQGPMWFGSPSQGSCVWRRTI